jgi:DNA repair ATPase RecN
VRKSSSGSRTISTLETLEGEARLKELAVMLAGPQYTQTSLNDARELQQKAATWRQSYHKATK